MKTKSALLRSTGVLLALLVYIALASLSARASQGQCGAVDIQPHYGGGGLLYLELTASPSSCDIYATTSIDNPSFPDPSRSGASPIPPTIKVASGSRFYVPFGHTMCIKAFAYKPLWTQSVNLSSACQHNPEDP